MGKDVTYRVGIPVSGAGGEPLGRLEKILFSESRRQVTGLVVRALDFQRSVPLSSVADCSGSEVRLSIGAPGFQSLPPFDPSDFEEVPPWAFPPGHHIELGALVTIKPLEIRAFGEAASLARRDFMGRSILMVATAIGVTLLVPIGGYILAAATATPTVHWTDLGVHVDDLPLDVPVRKVFRAISVSGWMRVPEERSVWLVRHSGPKDRWSAPEDATKGLDSPFETAHSTPVLTVLSPICPHLGCEPQWQGDQHLFVCPCHHSVYQINGNRISGPAPRPMDQLPVRIAPDGSISILYEQFAIGVAQKVRVS